MSELARRSRWCDQSILDERNSGFSSGPLRGRLSVWNSRRGNHLGQRSCASAPTGRTYGRKRSDQSTANDLARRGPSTYENHWADSSYGTRWRADEPMTVKETNGEVAPIA